MLTCPRSAPARASAWSSRTSRPNEFSVRVGHQRRDLRRQRPVSGARWGRPWSWSIRSAPQLSIGDFCAHKEYVTPRSCIRILSSKRSATIGCVVRAPRMACFVRNWIRETPPRKRDWIRWLNRETANRPAQGRTPRFNRKQPRRREGDPAKRTASQPRVRAHWLPTPTRRPAPCKSCLART
jgi:hypothetical protein